MLLRRLVAVLLTVALSAVCLPIAQGAELEIAAPSAILMDAATGTVLFEKNANERLAPASVTKVMTLLLVMEALEKGQISMEDQVIASDAAAGKGGSQVYLEPGEQMSMDEMLKSVVVSSANDCATALAEHVAGSEVAFVELMNQRAAELGMTDTHFVNCTGLDDEPNAAEHLTTAHDIAIMSRQLLMHDRIRDYTTIWMDTVRNGAFGLSNTNKLVRFYALRCYRFSAQQQVKLHGSGNPAVFHWHIDHQVVGNESHSGRTPDRSAVGLHDQVRCLRC